MPPAVIGGVIAGVGAIGASVIGGNAQSDAIDSASDAQAQASREALQFQREARDQNLQLQQPWINTGLTANAHMNALLGLAPPATSPISTTPTSGTGGATAPGGFTSPTGSLFFGNRILDMIEQKMANGEEISEDMLAFYNARRGTQGNTTTNPAANVPAITQPTAQAAYDAFKGYTGYTSRLEEANNQFNAKASAGSWLQSGAALLKRDQMNQDYASNEFAKYFGYLGGQQQVGVGATNALSGVTTNYANNASNIAQNQGNNLANAAIAQGNNTANMWSNVGSSFGGIMGSVFPSDERLKRDIVTVRVRSDGLREVEWTWRDHPNEPRQRGYIAQEVREIYPEAVIEDYRGTGYLALNHALIPHETKVAA